MSSNDSNIAPCGLNCGICDIHLAPETSESAEYIAKWIRENHDPECTADMIHCAGCPGDREDHWSPDCRILICCVDEHNLRYCSKCTDFPCTKLEEWASQCKKYGDALINLYGLRSEGRLEKR